VPRENQESEAYNSRTEPAFCISVQFVSSGSSPRVHTVQGTPTGDGRSSSCPNYPERQAHRQAAGVSPQVRFHPRAEPPHHPGQAGSVSPESPAASARPRSQQRTSATLAQERVVASVASSSVQRNSSRRTAGGSSWHTQEKLLRRDDSEFKEKQLASSKW
jgi:hypothetical protein